MWGGRTAAQLAWGGVVIMTIGLIGRVMGGFLLKRLPAAFVANGSILVLFFLLLLFQVPVLGVILAAAVLMAWFAASNFGAFWQIAGRAAPDGSVGTLFGFINFLANLGAVFFTLTFGWVKDHTGTFSPGFGVLAVFTALSLILGWSVIRKNAESGIRNAEQKE
jgi:nitrate/nitrite transporter NarK